MSQSTADRINALAERYEAKTYLEIGVFEGETFLDVNIKHKTAVDPSFKFDFKKFSTDEILFFEMTSDCFFSNLAQNTYSDLYRCHSAALTFDIIYIDGLHTFEQSLRDFLNATMFAHDKTLFIFDDTCPSDCFSAMTEDASLVIPYRQVAQLTSQQWQGDVFKTILAIHDFHRDYSYCTNVSIPNPQTLVWKTPSPALRETLFSSCKDVDALRYEDFLKYGWVLMPVEEHRILDFIEQKISPRLHRTGLEYSSLIKPAITQNEERYRYYIENLHQTLESTKAAIMNASSLLESQSPETAKTLKEMLRTLWGENY